MIFSVAGIVPSDERKAFSTRHSPILQRIGVALDGQLEAGRGDPRAQRTKNPGTLSSPGFLFEDGVAVTYFRVRKRHTIIGANSFHSPVRDGKAWFQAAVAAT